MLTEKPNPKHPITNKFKSQDSKSETRQTKEGSDAHFR